MWGTSISHSTSFILFSPHPFETSPCNAPVNFPILSMFLPPCRHASTLMLELRYDARGVVALAWGVSSWAQRGAARPASANWGYWAVCWTGRMNSWRVGGQWGPAKATEVTAIQNLGSQLKGTGWKRIMLLEQKKGSCFPVAHKGHSHAASQADSPKQQPHRSLVMWLHFLLLCTATGIITFVLQHSNNIWCLFLINQAVSVHISVAVAGDI